MDRFTGGCLCGSIRFVASGLPYRVGLCHCMDCRKHHGALFHASAVFAQDAVIAHAESSLQPSRMFARRRPLRARRPTRCSCRFACGARP
jgi:hypothetical protein